MEHKTFTIKQEMNERKTDTRVRYRSGGEERKRVREHDGDTEGEDTRGSLITQTKQNNPGTTE